LIFFLRQISRIFWAIKEDCTGEPPGELTTTERASNLVLFNLVNKPLRFSIFNGALPPDAIIPLRSIDTIVFEDENII
jgi:hypothetical protein